MMMSLKSFSQTDTTKIQLTKPVAKLVVKDLIRGDAAIKEVSLLQTVIVAKDSIILTKAEIIETQDLQLQNLNAILKATEEKYTTQEQLSKDLNKALKKEQRRNKFLKIGSGISTAAAITLALILK